MLVDVGVAAKPEGADGGMAWLAKRLAPSGVARRAIAQKTALALHLKGYTDFIIFNIEIIRNLDT